MKDLYADIEAEKATLGAIILDAEQTFGIISDKKINDDIFFEPKHDIIFRTMMALNREQKSIDAITLAERLKSKNHLDRVGGRMYLSELVDSIPTVAHFEFYLDTVVEKARLRALSKCTRIIPEMIKDGCESSEIVAKVITDVVANVDLKQSESPEVLHKQSLEGFQQAKNGHRVGLTSFLEPVNEVIGSYVPGSVYVIAGRPSNGKTCWGYNEVNYNAVGYNIPCAIASMEMKEKLLREMMAGALADVSIYSMMNGKYSNEQYARLKQAFDVIKKAPIYINDSRMTAEELVSWLTYMVRKHKIQLAVIDYIQLTKLSSWMRSNMSRNDQVGEFSAQIKDVTKRLDIVTLAISQISRSGTRLKENTPLPPTLEALRDSGSLEQDADAVMFVYKKPDVPFGEFMSDKDWDMEIDVAKHRIGPTGVKDVIFVRRRQRLESTKDYHEKTKLELAPSITEDLFKIKGKII